MSVSPLQLPLPLPSPRASHPNVHHHHQSHPEAGPRPLSAEPPPSGSQSPAEPPLPRLQCLPICQGRLLLFREICTGAFGRLFLAKDTSNGTDVAVKLEPLSMSANSRQNKSFLRSEFSVYEYLSERRRMRNEKRLARLARASDLGEEGDFIYMVMELFGPSLEDLFFTSGRHFPLKALLMIAEMAIGQLQSLHACHHVHRDVKPANFVVGASGADRGRIFLIDFGLAKRYWSEPKSRHMPFQDGRVLTGTCRFASVNAHKGFAQSRRDDLESLSYVLLYLLRRSLPWQDVATDAAGMEERIRKVGAAKGATAVEELCEGYPRVFQDLLEYSKTLKFEEEPDHERLKAMFRKYREQQFGPGECWINWSKC